MDILNSVIALKQKGQPKGITDHKFCNWSVRPLLHATPPWWELSLIQKGSAFGKQRSPSSQQQRPAFLQRKKNENIFIKNDLGLDLRVKTGVQINICLPNDDYYFRGDFWIMAETSLFKKKLKDFKHTSTMHNQQHSKHLWHSILLVVT